jgi:hypothetical protein
LISSTALTLIPPLFYPTIINLPYPIYTKSIASGLSSHFILITELGYKVLELITATYFGSGAENII